MDEPYKTILHYHCINCSSVVLTQNCRATHTEVKIRTITTIINISLESSMDLSSQRLFVQGVFVQKLFQLNNVSLSDIFQSNNFPQCKLMKHEQTKNWKFHHFRFSKEMSRFLQMHRNQLVEAINSFIQIASGFQGNISKILSSWSIPLQTWNNKGVQFYTVSKLEDYCFE